MHSKGTIRGRFGGEIGGFVRRNTIEGHGLRPRGARGEAHNDHEKHGGKPEPECSSGKYRLFHT
jgi:hypothetical protein